MSLFVEQLSKIVIISSHNFSFFFFFFFVFVFASCHTGGFEGLGGAGCDNDDPLVNLSNDSRHSGSPSNNGTGSNSGGSNSSSSGTPSGAITHINGEEFDPKRNYLVSVS